MRATPHPISSIRYCLFSTDPDILRAFPSPAWRVMSVNFAPNAARASSAPPIARNPRRERLPALSLMRAAFHAPVLQKLATLLFELVGLPIELDERLHHLSTLFGLT